MNDCLCLIESHGPSDDRNTFLVEKGPIGSAFHSQAHDQVLPGSV